MSDYKRFVGYFYEYIDGKRQRNAGFIKAEERNGIWRVGLQLRAARWPEKRLEILGYGAEGDGYDTVLLGMGCPQGDIFWQKLQFHEDTVNLKGKSFEQLAGMWIPCGHGRDFLSHWANDEPKVEKLWTLGERRRRTEEKPEAVTETVPEEENLPGQTEAEGRAEEGKIQKTAEEQSKEELKLQQEDEMVQRDAVLVREDADPVEMDHTEIVRPEKIGTDPMEETCRKRVRPEERLPEEVLANAEEKAPFQQIADWNQGFLKRGDEKTEKKGGESPAFRVLRERCRKAALFEGEEECLLLCPGDIQWLGEQGWPVGRNNFLMQGFCQYHHLLLGRSRQKGYYLGVPGIGAGRSRVLASSFGFTEFRPAKISGYPGQFGYWCRIIDPSPEDEQRE